MWQQAQDWLKKLTNGGRKQPEPDPWQPSEAERNPCCHQPGVHIAYRGKADDRLYLAKDRQWQEVRFYQPNGLRVFCKVCRRRLL